MCVILILIYLYFIIQDHDDSMINENSSHQTHNGFDSSM